MFRLPVSHVLVAIVILLLLIPAAAFCDSDSYQSDSDSYQSESPQRLTLPEDGFLLKVEDPNLNPVIPPPLKPDDPVIDLGGSECTAGQTKQCITKGDGSQYCECCSGNQPPACIMTTTKKKNDVSQEVCGCSQCVTPARISHHDRDTYDGTKIFSGPKSTLSCLNSFLNKCKSKGIQRKHKTDDDCVIKKFEDSFNYSVKHGSKQWQGWDSLFPALPGGKCQDEDDGYECHAIVFMNDDCQEADMNQPYRLCGWMDAQYIESPISLIWDGVTDINTVSSVIQFPINPNDTEKFYVWRGSVNTPLLVYDPYHRGTVDSGHQLFGNWTFGGKKTAALAGSDVQAGPWRNGYEALGMLDLNNDGKVSGAELRPIALWFDRNQDGVSQAGEVRRAIDEGVTALFYKSDFVDPANSNIHAALGFTRTVNGQEISGSSVDWFSRSYDSALEAKIDLRGRLVEPIPSSGQANPARRSMAEREINGVWVWTGTRHFAGERPTGVLVIDGEGLEIIGQTIVEAPLTGNQFGFNSVLSSSPVKGERVVLSDGRIRMKFETISYTGKKTKTVAELSADRTQLTGRSSSQLDIDKNSGRPQVHEYNWTAVRN